MKDYEIILSRIPIVRGGRITKVSTNSDNLVLHSAWTAEDATVAEAAALKLAGIHGGRKPLFLRDALRAGKMHIHIIELQPDQPLHLQGCNYDHRGWPVNVKAEGLSELIE